jgi:hypothetical protein
MAEAKQKVLVLRDVDGNYYTLTPEVIELARVRSEEHDQVISTLLKKQKTGSDLSISAVFPKFEVVGSYNRSDDPRIKKSFVSPKVVLVASPVSPDP